MPPRPWTRLLLMMALACIALSITAIVGNIARCIILIPAKSIPGGHYHNGSRCRAQGELTTHTGHLMDNDVFCSTGVGVLKLLVSGWALFGQMLSCRTAPLPCRTAPAVSCLHDLWHGGQASLLHDAGNSSSISSMARGTRESARVLFFLSARTMK